MDYLILIAIVTLILTWFHLRRPGLRRGKKFPPGPYPFPIIGNILQLGRKPHHSLADLSKKYGPLMSIKLGSIYTVVASSPEVAKLFLQEHDQVFSGRIIPAAMKVHGYDTNSMALIPAGEKWRKLRKLLREQMLSTRRLEAGEGLRREMIRKVLDYVHEFSISGRAVNVGEMAFATLLNLLMVTLFSVDDFTDFDSDATQQLQKIIKGMVKALGAPNIADFFSFLKRFDPQGIKKQSEFHVGEMLAVLEAIINKRLESRSSSSLRKNDFLDSLVDLMEGDHMSFKEIQLLFVDLFLGGTDTTQNTVEWAMTELLNNPEKMVHAKNELRNVIGKNKQVVESDVSRLPYLRAIIKETLRLHPPAPLLFPRRADRDIEMAGYTIPKNAQILVNIWAIGRDSSIWGSPSLFEPERFLDNKIGFEGQDFEFLPFGSGRRICPGVPLSNRLLHLMIGSLIHNFDWKLEEGVKLEEFDIMEEFGISIRKAVPLKAIPVKI